MLFLKNSAFTHILVYFLKKQKHLNRQPKPTEFSRFKIRVVGIFLENSISSEKQ